MTFGPTQNFSAHIKILLFQMMLYLEALEYDWSTTLFLHFQLLVLHRLTFSNLYSLISAHEWSISSTELLSPIAVPGVNECCYNYGGGQQHCMNTVGATNCTCLSGYELVGTTDCRGSAHIHWHYIKLFLLYFLINTLGGEKFKHKSSHSYKFY